MQTYSAIPLMPNPAVPQKDSRIAPPKNDRENASFTDALDQELAQGKETEAKQPEQQEMPPKEQAILQNPGIAAVPWLVQMPLQEQILPETGMIQPQIQNPEQAEPAIMAAAAVQEEPEAVSVLSSHIEMPKGADADKPQMPMTANAGDMPEMFSVKDKLQAAAQAPNFGEAVQGTMQQEKTETADFTAVQPQTVGASGEREQTETGTETKTAAPELVRVQTERPVQNAAKDFDIQQPKPAAGETVDMTDPKAGIQKLSETMAKNMAKGLREFEVWLEPANLGKLGIKVAYESGRAAVSIMCMNEKTMEIISQNAKNLGTILEQNTGTNTVVVIEHPESDYLQQNAEKENQRGYEQQQNSEGNSEDNDTESQSFLQQLRLGLAQ